MSKEIVKVNSENQLETSQIESFIYGEESEGDELLTNPETGYSCFIPRHFADYRAMCGPSLGYFVEMSEEGKRIVRGSDLSFVLVGHRDIIVSFGEKYVNSQFLEIYCLPVAGALRKYLAGGSEYDVDPYTLRLSTFVVPAKTKNGFTSKSVDVFYNCVRGASAANIGLFNALPLEERRKIKNVAQWLKSQSTQSIYNRVIDVSFVEEKTKDFTYSSLGFRSRECKTDLEKEAVIFSKKIRDDFDNQGLLRCVNPRLMNQETYINSIYTPNSKALPQGETVTEAPQLTATPEW